MLSYKYRAYPSKIQQQRLRGQMKLAKLLYNLLFKQAKVHYKQTGKTLTQFDMNKYIGQLKTEYPELSQLHSQAAQNVSKRLGDAYKAFFRRVKEKKSGKKVKVGFPKPKKFVSSLTYPQSGFKIKNERRLTISKVGNIPFVLHRLPKGQIKTCVIKQYRSGKWYVAFSTETPDKAFESNNKEPVGIDVGLTSFVTLSNGQKIPTPKYFRISEGRLKTLQRRISRKKKGSRNRREAKFRFARLEEKVANQRLDFLHKLTHDQVKSYSRIGIEKLDVQDMQKNPRLAKSIGDASWSMYRQLLHYKAVVAGCEVIDVDPKNTTKTCNACGNIQNMPLSKRIYNCNQCGHSEDRDINAAKNILTRATVGLTGSNACGDLSSTLPAKVAQDTSMKHGTISDIKLVA